MKRLLIILPLLLVLAVSPFVQAADEPLSSVALESIRNNCVNAQLSLQRIQQTEKPTRINRGYLYDSTLKLMSSFNGRVAYNNIESPELLSITSQYQNRLQTFTEEYTKYDDSLSDLISYDCEARPAEFYADLVETRRLRALLTSTINELDGLLDKYQTSVDSVRNLVEAD